jgi:hypothetical protein
VQRARRHERAVNHAHQGKFATPIEHSSRRYYFRAQIGAAIAASEAISIQRVNIMSRVLAALSAVTLVALSLPTTASAGCYNCYVPLQPCATCYQQRVVPPQYRIVNQTVLVEPGRVIAHRTPAQYRTVLVPKTVMVAPEGVQYERIPPQYATVQRTEMVAPPQAYVVPVAPRCGSCGW